MTGSLRARLLQGLAALALGSIAACSSAPFSRDRDDESKRETQQRLLDLEKEATRSRLEIERLRERLAALEVAAREPRRSASPEPPSPPEATAPEPRAPSRPPAGSAIEEADLELAPETPSATARAVDESEEYERALSWLRDGRPEAAEAALRAFVAARPDSDLADNAWFWIGESLLVRDQVEAALAAYRSGVESYPEGNKTPDALYKIGACLELQGDRNRAIEVWRELARRYPQTVAAERAAEALGNP